MTDFLFECFSEEMPARMQDTAAQQLASRMEEALKAARLEYSAIETFVSPRHLAVRVTGLPDAQADQMIERKGPKTSAPQPAIDGFLKSTGLSLDQLEKRTVGKDEVYFAISEEKGQPAATALKAIAEDILANFHWPKSMRWGARSISWVRPLQNMLCLFGSNVVPVQFGHLTANNITYGHRFLAPAAITLSSPADYESALEKAKVIVVREARKAMILTQLEQAAAAEKLELHHDTGLLEEVTGLVEWPNVIVGSFEDKYLDLPPEVLVSEMRHHQKYFALKQAGGSITNRFLIASNMVNADGGKAVAHGNGRVLRARLEDGAFYWNQDRKKNLSDWATGLANVTFHAKLGSIAQKVERITGLAEKIAITIQADPAKTKRAAQLAKADLTSGMVGEFPELQGIMGRYYALEQKEDAAVANAIRDHYKPLGASDDVPNDSIAIAVSIADKADSLAGMFAIGEKPTGSKDPYALRRAALGILRTILQHNLPLDLRLNLIVHATQSFANQGFAKSDKAETCRSEIFDFFIDRLKVMLRDEGVRHDIVSAVLSGDDADITRIAAKARALMHFIAQDDGTNLLAAYRRASNILAAEEKKDNARYQDAPQETLFELDAEKALHKQLETIHKPVKNALQSEDYTAAMQQLATLRTSVDAYFDAVMVNAEDAAIRRNRLNTLNLIRTRMDDVAGFARIEG